MKETKPICQICNRKSNCKSTINSNNERWECSHVNCPNRRSAWSDREFEKPDSQSNFNPYKQYFENVN